MGDGVFSVVLFIGLIVIIVMSSLGVGITLKSTFLEDKRKGYMMLVGYVLLILYISKQLLKVSSLLMYICLVSYGIVGILAYKDYKRRTRRISEN
ncbi:hypothetical protein N782_12955 [Pontibacillus yanchengensis Y32]|uniref:Uncharacterized protein n=1 Tax=Pontibacillus yanchengensis Y32 TaxID=1385514 RepID=A0A0A2T9A6_9BACI|nr:hypothetical protein N782_12955 [Pontibacillus yanchengensis Y32]